MKKIMLIVLVSFISFGAVSQELTEIDEIAPFSEELAAVRKGNQWGFINTNGALVIDFRNDLVWDKDADTSKYGIAAIQRPTFHNGRCLVEKSIDGIPVYGFIDTTGKLVIEHQFLNVSPFKDGYTTGIIFKKEFVGRNEIKMDVYKHQFHEVVMDTSGKIHEYLVEPDNIQMTKSRYKRPWLRTKLLSENLVAIRGEDNFLEVRKLDL